MVEDVNENLRQFSTNLPDSLSIGQPGREGKE
jgi:hypothetical protein